MKRLEQWKTEQRTTGSRSAELDLAAYAAAPDRLTRVVREATRAVRGLSA